jgi:hypothetical protein
LIQGLARFSPEGAGQLGVDGLDEQIIDLKPGFIDRQKQTIKESIQTLQGRLGPIRAEVEKDLTTAPLLIEGIIQREHLVTLPKRSMRFRLASEAESARLPSPYFQQPRLLGNTG